MIHFAEEADGRGGGNTGAFDASLLFNHDASTTLEIMSRESMRLLKIKSEQAFERTYGILRDELSEVPVPSVEGISNTHRMTRFRSDELANFNPLLVLDLSFRQHSGRGTTPDVAAMVRRSAAPSVGAAGCCTVGISSWLRTSWALRQSAQAFPAPDTSLVRLRVGLVR